MTDEKFYEMVRAHNHCDVDQLVSHLYRDEIYGGCEKRAGISGAFPMGLPIVALFILQKEWYDDHQSWRD